VVEAEVEPKLLAEEPVLVAVAELTLTVVPVFVSRLSRTVGPGAAAQAVSSRRRVLDRRLRFTRVSLFVVMIIGSRL